MNGASSSPSRLYRFNLITVPARKPANVDIIISSSDRLDHHVHHRPFSFSFTKTLPTPFPRILIPHDTANTGDDPIPREISVCWTRFRSTCFFSTKRDCGSHRLIYPPYTSSQRPTPRFLRRYSSRLLSNPFYCTGPIPSPPWSSEVLFPPPP